MVFFAVAFEQASACSMQQTGCNFGSASALLRCEKFGTVASDQHEVVVECEDAAATAIKRLCWL